MKLSLILGVCFLTITTVYGLFKDCNKVPSTINVIVNGVAEKTDNKPVVLKKGTNATFEVDFKAVKATKTLKASVHGIIAGVPVPFPIPNADGCKSGVPCPVKVGDVDHYKSYIPVLTSYPSIRVAVKWELVADDNSDEFCILIPVELQN